MQGVNLRGYLIVALGFIALGITFSARAVLGLAMPLWETEFGWSRSFISTGGALALLITAVLAPITGYIVDRYGARVLLSFGLTICGAAMLLLTGMTAQWHFMIGYGVLAAVGFGVVSMNAVATASAQQFPDRVGLVSGISTSGSTGGQLVFVPVVAAVIAASGWRSGYMAAGVACLALAPLVWFLIESRPKSSAAEEVNTAPLRLSTSIVDIVSHPAYAVLLLTFVICGVTTAGVIETHLLPYAAACGFGQVSSASAYGLLSAFNLVGMITAGWLSDRVHRGRLLVTIYSFRALAFVLLIYIGNDLTLLLAFAVLFGIFDYSTVPVTAGLIAAHMGLKRLGLAMGILVAGHQVGAAAGAFMGGALFDQFAEYQIVWIVSIALSATAALLSLLLVEPRNQQGALQSTQG